MSETTRPTTPLPAQPQAPTRRRFSFADIASQPTINLDELRVPSGSMESFFDEVSDFRSNDNISQFFNRGVSTAAANNRNAEEWSIRRTELMQQMMVDNDAIVGRISEPTRPAPPLERITTRRPDVEPPTLTGRIRGVDPDRDIAYLRAPTLTNGTLTINDTYGQRRVTIGDTRDNFTQAAAASLGYLGGAPTQAQGGTNHSEQQFINFLKEKITLNVSLSQLSAGLELKVSLNLAETNEELLSAEDFVKLD